MDRAASHLKGMYVYVHTCMGPNVCEGTHACVSMCTWRSEVDARCFPWTFYPLFTEAESH